MSSVSNEELVQLIRDDLAKYDGVRRPVKASKFEQVFKWSTSPWNLHPNPEDEFCDPEIGPSFRIISDYAAQFRKSSNLGADIVGEALVVEKMYPEGYMLLNGHHRWAAALRIGLKKVPIKVVNLTHEEDMQKMLANARSDRRIVFDLDEVVFCQSESDAAESALRPPFNRLFKERIRKGFPALANDLQNNKFDIWVYTRGLYSVDYLEMLFKQYHIRVNGIVSEARNANKIAAALEKGAAKTGKTKDYAITLHADRDSVLYTNSKTKDFEHVTFEASDDNWGTEVLKVVRDLTSAAQ